MTLKLCNCKEYYYSALIFNYNIFLELFHLFIIIQERIKEAGPELTTFYALLTQYIFITIIVWVGFFYEWDKFFNEEEIAMEFFLTLVISYNIIPSFYYYKYYKEGSESCVSNIFPILYVPMVVLFCYTLSGLVEEKYILSIIIIILCDLFLISIVSLILDKINSKLIIFICLISNCATILPFHFFWLQNDDAIIIISSLSFIIDIYFIICYRLNEKQMAKNHCFNLLYEIISFDYLYLCIIIGILLYPLYLIVLCCKKICFY